MSLLSKVYRLTGNCEISWCQRAHHPNRVSAFSLCLPPRSEPSQGNSKREKGQAQLSRSFLLISQLFIDGKLD